MRTQWKSALFRKLSKCFMVVRVGCFVLVAIVVGGCGAENTPAVTDAPSPEPTATTVSVADLYDGPLLSTDNSLSIDSECSSDGSCGASLAPLVTLETEILPLTLQTVEWVTVGVPEGYAPITLQDEIIITAIAAETLGGYTFAVQPLPDEAALTQRLDRFDTPDITTGKTINTPTLTGVWLPTAYEGAIAILQDDQGQILFVEAFADAPNWSVFEPTFVNMVESITYADDGR